MYDRTHESLSLTALEKQDKIHKDFHCRITPGTVSSGLHKDLGVEQRFFIWVESMGHRPHQIPFEGINLSLTLVLFHQVFPSPAETPYLAVGGCRCCWCSQCWQCFSAKRSQELSCSRKAHTACHSIPEGR